LVVRKSPLGDLGVNKRKDNFLDSLQIDRTRYKRARALRATLDS